MCAKGAGGVLNSKSKGTLNRSRPHERIENWVANTWLPSENGDTYRQEVVWRGVVAKGMSLIYFPQIAIRSRINFNQF